MKDWLEVDNALEKTFEFVSFKDAIAWMQTCVAAIEAQNHHPEWQNVYNKVIVRLTSHSEGNTVTQKDHNLAEILDSLYCQPL